MSYMENTAEQKICKIIKDAFKLGFDSETNDAIDYFDGIDESEEIISQLRANTSHFAEQVHSIAAALGMPIAPGHSVIHRVKELIAENNQLRENLWQHAERLEEVEMAAQEVVDRWETPLWKDAEPTAAVIYRLRDILANKEIGD